LHRRRAARSLRPHDDPPARLTGRARRARRARGPAPSRRRGAGPQSLTPPPRRRYPRVPPRYRPDRRGAKPDLMTKVLVFESDASFAGELRNELGRLGCTVQVVDDGNVGLSAAASDRPDLILLSIELPRMNGFSVCNK